VILVFSTSHAIRGERLLSDAGIPCRLIPVPRQLSSDCGSCIRIAASLREAAGEILEAGKVGVQEIVPLFN
jgi:hypothetical protein